VQEHSQQINQRLIHVLAAQPRAGLDSIASPNRSSLAGALTVLTRKPARAVELRDLRHLINKAALLRTEFVCMDCACEELPLLTFVLLCYLIVVKITIPEQRIGSYVARHCLVNVRVA